MNKAELVSELAGQLSVKKVEAEQFVSTFWEIIMDTVSNDEDVNLIGIVSFKARRRAARIGRNPQTGAEVKIAASKGVSVKIGAKFKDRVNK